MPPSQAAELKALSLETQQAIVQLETVFFKALVLRGGDATTVSIAKALGLPKLLPGDHWPALARGIASSLKEKGAVEVGRIEVKGQLFWHVRTQT
ncbi:MAG: hypothetical protein OXI46_05655 [Gemmatimonadota bacterium]|nr:hypothetical protein [Gemmatimonadota bacterium]